MFRNMFKVISRLRAPFRLKIAAVLVLYFCPALSAQSLYVSNMQVRYKNSGTGTGYCDDIDFRVDGTLTCAAFNTTFSSNAVAGTVKYFTGYSTRTLSTNIYADRTITQNISGTYNGSYIAYVTGFDDWANGTASGTFTAASIGGSATVPAGWSYWDDTVDGNMYYYSNAITIPSTCTVPVIHLNGFDVAGAVNSAGTTISGTVASTAVTSPGLTCSGGPQGACPGPGCQMGKYKWTGSGTKRVDGTMAARTVSGPANYYDFNASFYHNLTGEVWGDSALIQFERQRTTYPGNCLGLCASLVCISTVGSFGINSLTFEIFKYGPGTNELDPSSSPPIKTISLYNIGMCYSENNVPYKIGSYCAAWDASYNLNGQFGKTNGQFGFRAQVTTRETTPQGTSIDIEQTAAYPGQNQIPMQVDVTDIHMVKSSPTPVGSLTKVAAQPYNVQYRLSKDATATISIWDADTSHQSTPGIMPGVRNIVYMQPRSGEGVPDGVLTNGDFWDGRNEDGAMMPPGSYLVRIEAASNDMWGTDLAWPTTISMTLDPLQVTDVAVNPLGTSSTDQATISYMLTETATVYVEIYTPGTSFVTTNVSGAPTVSGTSGTLLRRFVKEVPSRTRTTSVWDGRDETGYPVCDGDYVFAIYAELSSNGTIGSHTWTEVETRSVKTGILPVARGRVLAFISPSSTIIGSSPSAAGLEPFYFRYTPARETTVDLNITTMDGSAVVRHLVSGEVRYANVLNRDIWDGKDNAGNYVSSGTYLAELVTEDPFQCAAVKKSTTTALIPVDMFRAVDLRTAPLLSASSATAYIAFQLSEPMYIELKVYPKDTVINPSVWPPALSTTPVYSVGGMRPGRMTITEPWDGRNTSGIMSDDGRYPFTIVARSSGSHQVMYATDKLYGYVDISRGQIGFTSFDVYPTIPIMYNSSDTINLPPFGVEYSVTRQSSVSVQAVSLDVLPQVFADVVSGIMRDGDTLYKDVWDGRCTDTTACPGYGYVPNGYYNLRVVAQDISSSQLASKATVQQTVEVYPFRIYDLSIMPLTVDNPAVVSYQVSEPMKVVTKIYKPGTNPSGPVDPVNSLIKRIVGIRPARAQISEYWDGTDFTLSKVPDGNYVFKVYGSTVSEAIDTLYGNYDLSNPPPLATGPDGADIIINNIPVTKGGTYDLCGDFSRETYFAPNPYNGTAGWFKIPSLLNGRTDLKIYNLAGDLVYKKDYGLRGTGNDVDGLGRCSVTHTHEACWPKVNSSGRTVAQGVYFAVVRFETSEGTRDVCQVVKKILIP